MELMSPMFLCALAALLPQALGKSRKISSVSELVKNKFKDEKQLYDSKFVTNINLTSNINKVSDLQSVFMNPDCKECHSCMELSIKAHKVHSRDKDYLLKTNDVPNEIDNIEENTTHRNKRNLVVSDVNIANKSTKKSKSKKSKNNKSVSVTKYSNKGNVYALKVKETITPILLDLQNQTNTPETKCQVYRVTETFSCNSLEAKSIFSEKRKIKKTKNKEKRNHEMKKDKDTDRTIVPQFKKRQVVEDSQVPENFMPSIEEMY